MPWLLMFHIAALLCWCGTLLYLPGLLVGRTGGVNTVTQPAHSANYLALPRLVYTRIATPAALTAIIAGTLVFYRYGIWDVWLMVKLILVTLLVVLHLLTGLLIAKTERGKVQRIKAYAYVIALLLGATMTAITWLVLAKPLQEL